MEEKLEMFIPTRKWVESLQVGDKAPDCLGEMVEVIAIENRGYDLDGLAYVEAVLDQSPLAYIFKEDTIFAQVLDLFKVFTAKEVLELQKQLADIPFEGELPDLPENIEVVRL